MKQFFKNSWLKIILGTIAIVFIILFIISKTSGSSNESLMHYYGNNLSSAPKITCSIPQLLNANYNNNEITQSLSKPETNPILFTFSEFNSDSELAQLSYVDATQTISTLPIFKYVDNDEKLIFLDGTGENYFSVYTIFKKSGLIIYSKSVDLFGIKSGSLAMGTCLMNF